MELEYFAPSSRAALKIKSKVDKHSGWFNASSQVPNADKTPIDVVSDDITTSGGLLVAEGGSFWFDFDFLRGDETD
ncbi:hypothetical protein L1887_34842 [Cichorium endivia]|nr:hypothetical protein L1887_34842 [Cichorium endivia]